MKVWAISLAYNEAWIIRESIERYYATKSPDVETVHIIVDAHWPINYPAWRKELEKLCNRFGIILFDPGENLGLHGNFNYAWSKLAIPDNALVIGYDVDSWPLTQNWDMAMAEIFVADPTVGWLSLWHQHSTRELDTENRKGGDEVIAGHRVAVPKTACMNSVCGFRQGWLRKVGGLKEFRKYYGTLEVCMFPSLAEHGLRQVFLRDFTEEPHFAGRGSAEYTAWKYNYAHLGETTADFAEWIKQRV